MTTTTTTEPFTLDFVGWLEAQRGTVPTPRQCYLFYAEHILKLTPQQMADALGLSRSYVYRLQKEADEAIRGAAFPVIPAPEVP